MIELKFNVFSLLISIALIISIAFGFLLLFRRTNRRANLFLALLMFIVAFWNASILVLNIGIYQYAAGIIWIPLSYTLALGPCFYFYIRFMSEIEWSKSLKIWPHFIPVVFEVILFLIEVYQGLPEGKGYFDTQTYLLLNPIVNILAILSLFIYSFFARRRIQSYHNWVKENFSHYHRYNLNWLYRLSSIFLFFLALWFAYFIIDFFLFEYRLSFFDYYPFHLILAIISIWLCSEAFLKPELIYPEKDLSNIIEKTSKTIPDKEIQEKAQWLNQQINKNRLYLDPELSLKSLAEILNLHPNLVSKIINEGLGQSFSDCINSFRVHAVIKKLKQNKGARNTFLAIAFECGFNSKTTFNRVFKKQTGQTPLQYSKNMSHQ